MVKSAEKHLGMKNVYASRQVYFGALFVPRLWSVPRLLYVRSNFLREYKIRPRWELWAKLMVLWDLAAEVNLTIFS